MKSFSFALMYIAFFSLIGAAVWITKSAWALWALLAIMVLPEEE